MNEMTRKKVDVLVVTYNEEKYIRRCLESILMQTVKEDVVIYIGDDSSNDGTPKIIAEYASKYPNQIVPVFHKQNMGASANLRHLLEMADDEFIAFCDGDDYWVSSDKLETQRKFLFQYPQYAGNVHNVKIIDGTGKDVGVRRLDWLTSSDDIGLEEYDGMHLPGQLSSLCIRNFKYMGLTDLALMESDRQVSDKVIFLLTLFCGRIHRLPLVMGAYRLVRGAGEDNASSLRIDSICSMDAKDMHLVNCMEQWLSTNSDQKNKFIQARSQIIATAIFHKIKYPAIRFGQVWRECWHKGLVVTFLPLAVCEKIRTRIKMKLRLVMR